MNNYIYEIRNLKHFYNTDPVLDIPQLSVSQGSIVGLIGPNGSGKSTFLKLLGFIERPGAGEIYFKGRRAEPFSEDVRFSVTLLPQTPYLMKRSVFKNIAYGLQIRGVAGDYRSRIYEALNKVGLPGEIFANRLWYELSGGEAQRAALAARMVLNPEVLLLDEPTASVDAASVQLIKDASVNACRERGTTLIIASHDWQWLYEICDEVIHLFKGRFAGTGNESVVFGPWYPRNNGFWEKILHDGQHIVVSQPPEKNAAAVIKSDAVTVHMPESDSRFQVPAWERENHRNICLDGMVSRLVFEKRTQKIIATILIGNLPMTARFSQPQIYESGIYPGQRVKFCYDPNSIQWL